MQAPRHVISYNQDQLIQKKKKKSIADPYFSQFHMKNYSI